MSNETTQPTQAPTAKATASFAIIAPVLFGFFIMGFVDFVGVAASRVQHAFAKDAIVGTLTNTLATGGITAKESVIAIKDKTVDTLKKAFAKETTAKDAAAANKDTGKTLKESLVDALAEDGITIRANAVASLQDALAKDVVTISDGKINTLGSAVFFWFLVFSIPTSLLMNRIGRKNTVLVSLGVTVVAMLVPFVGNSFPVFVVAFALVGIGNAIIQVSLNPLLTNVVRGEYLTSSLNYGQFIKAIASLIGAPLASIAGNYLGGWKMAFLVFAAMTVLSAIWMMLTPIKREIPEGKPSTFAECFGLLSDKTILLFFLGILCVVGIDVGMNFTAPKILEFRCLMSNDAAGYGQTIYFAGRTIGAFIGASLLLKVSPRQFFRVSMIVTIAAMAVMLFMGNRLGVQALIFIIGFAVANVFGIIFGAALQRLPAKANEISGLMIMGVSGGAIFPFLMGAMSDATKGLGAQVGAIIVLLACAAYLMFCALSVKERKA
jgi:fucose permease